MGERRYNPYSFTTSALDGSEWSALHPCRSLAPGKGYPLLIVQGVWWAPKPVLNTEATEKIISHLPGIEPRSPGCPAGSQILYWLIYPAHTGVTYKFETDSSQNWDVSGLMCLHFFYFSVAIKRTLKIMKGNNEIPIGYRLQIAE
jgi:hypothetical protein